MKKTIFFKTFVANIIVLTIFTSLITIFTINTVRQWHIESLIDELKNNSKIMMPVINNKFKNNPQSIETYITNLGKDIDTRITIINIDGKVFADSKSDANKMENHGSRLEIVEALVKESSYNIRFSTTQMTEMLYFATPIRKEGSILGILRLSVYINDINSILKKLNNKIIMLIILLFAVSLIITFLLSKRISNPIKRISSASKEIRDGNYDIKVYVKDTGEIGTLAKNFNSMVSVQKEMFSELKRNQHELETILSSINEGLAVIDIDGNIVLSNHNFYKNIGIEQSKGIGKRIWELYRAPNLNSTIKEVFENKINKTEVIQIDTLFFRTSFNLIKENNLLVITFHNITELKKLEQIKKDFVLNASHELKTPLTSILGFIETLEEEIPESNKNYLNIIKRNSERLANIVNDLLLINKLEDKDYDIIQEDVDIYKTINESIIINMKEAEKKNISIEYKKFDDHISIKGNRSKIEDMMINLINNAIKYTDEGKIQVLYGYKDKKNIFIRVNDTGIGIDNKNLNRIFERFYVVDKSRSREISGTGLGLSIVKHIVNMHNGSIDVKSEPGTGTTFTVILPI